MSNREAKDKRITRRLRKMLRYARAAVREARQDARTVRAYMGGAQ